MQAGPLDQITDYDKQFSIYDLTSGTNIIYDFGAAGYGANDLLDDDSQGQVQLFGVDQYGATISVLIGGVSTPLDGTGLAFLRLDPNDDTKAYITYNLPNVKNNVYYFQAVFIKDGIQLQTVIWTNQTLR